MTNASDQRRTNLAGASDGARSMLTADRASVRTPNLPMSKFAERCAGSAEASLRRDVFAGLTSDPLVSTRHIVVVVVADAVTLSGYVTSQAQKDAVSAATRRVKGVGLIVNDIGVAVPCQAPLDVSNEPLPLSAETPPPAPPQVLSAFPRLRAHRPPFA